MKIRTQTQDRVIMQAGGGNRAGRLIRPRIVFTLASLLLVLGLTCVLLSGASAANPPVWLVEAIICHESTGDPNAVNIAGVTHYPEDEEASRRLIRKAVDSSVSYDVGLMQINRFWIDRFDIDPVTLLDPKINIELGTTILVGEILRHGLNWIAVGKYHGPDLERGRRYAWKIFTVADSSTRTQTEPGGVSPVVQKNWCGKLLGVDGGWLAPDREERVLAELIENSHE